MPEKKGYGGSSAANTSLGSGGAEKARQTIKKAKSRKQSALDKIMGQMPSNVTGRRGKPRK